MNTTNWLSDSASMAMDAMLARLDMERGARPYFWIDYQSQPPRAQHSYWDTCDIAGRFVDGLALARILTGRQDGRAAEEMLRTFLWAQQDPTNGLFFNPDDEHESTNAEMSKYIPAAGVMTSARHADMFCQRGPMLAMITLMQLGDDSMRARLSKMVHGLRAIAVREDDELRFASYRWAEAIRPEWIAPQSVPEKWTGYRYASLTALARYVELTRDPVAVELALGLATHYMRRGEVPPDGRYRCNTHSGGVLPTAAGIARLGAALGRSDLIQWAERVYLWTRANMTDFGFLPDGLGLDGFFAGTCETCALADFVHLAVVLSECGAGEYWDDVERLVRNQLLANQYTDVDAIRRAFPGVTDDVLAMLRGGFECAARPNDLFNWAGAEACCIGGGVRALYLAWRAAIETRDGETSVRMGVTRQTNAAIVTAYAPWDGRIDVQSLRTQRIRVRIPEGVAASSVRIFVDGRPAHHRSSGRWIVVDDVGQGRVVTASFELQRAARAYRVADVDYQADWLGDTIVAMRPPGVRHPTYRRDVRTFTESAPPSPTMHSPPLW